MLFLGGAVVAFEQGMQIVDLEERGRLHGGLAYEEVCVRRGGGSNSHVGRRGVCVCVCVCVEWWRWWWSMNRHQRLLTGSKLVDRAKGHVQRGLVRHSQSLCAITVGLRERRSVEFDPVLCTKT